MTKETIFSGFTKETVRFYTALRKNNNRAWFEANRATYDAGYAAYRELYDDLVGLFART